MTEQEQAPSLLYKYRSLDSLHLKSILSKGEIYFSPIVELNDPCEYYFIAFANRSFAVRW